MAQDAGVIISYNNFIIEITRRVTAGASVQKEKQHDGDTMPWLMPNSVWDFSCHTQVLRRGQ